MKRITLVLLLIWFAFIATATPALAQKVNPNQINWPLAAGSGAPTSACTSVNYGEPYTDISGQNSYWCGVAGWFQVSGGGGTSGVRSINTVVGAFTFNFASGAGSCSGTTCTFNGGSGSGVGAGIASEIAAYNGPDGVIGDSILQDSAFLGSPLGNGALVYNGWQGIIFSTSHGGSYNLTTNNNTSSPSGTPASQINLITALNGLSTPQTGAGNITATCTDNTGNNSACNVNIGASTPVGASNSNSGNVTISASGYYANNNGFINLVGSGIDISDNGAGTSITTNSAQSGAAITLTNNAPSGSIKLNAAGTGDAILLSSPEIGLDGVFIVTPDSATFSVPVTVNDGSGTGGGLNSTEGTPIAGHAGLDGLWADSTAHRWLMNSNNGGAQVVPGVATAGTPGHCWTVASDGYGLVAAVCGDGGTAFTPTHSADNGAGTGGSLAVSFVTGANDDNGYINLTTGASPAASSGVITVTFGGTYANARKCSASAASALAMALGGNGFFVGSGTSTATAFVIDIGTTALPANTTGYVIEYHCGN
jgi:hypothetical protein